MNTIMGSVDTIMLSAYSDDAVAAVSIANQILFLIQVLACIVTTGTSILWVQLLYFIFSAVLKSYGRTTQCMYVSIGMNVCNIVLNYLLIFGKFGLPAMGIRGAAIATVAGRVFGFLILVWILFDVRGKQFQWKICWEKMVPNMRKVITYGMPAAGEQISYNLAQFLVMVFVTMMGMKAVTAQSYIDTCVRFIYVFSVSLGQGTAIMIGWSAGAARIWSMWHLSVR